MESEKKEKKGKKREKKGKKWEKKTMMRNKGRGKAERDGNKNRVGKWGEKGRESERWRMIG